MSSIRIQSPAKVNLGLAILGKRDDGYHEIDTILAMIDLCDEITLTVQPESGFSILGMDDVPLESNLMWKAARLWGNATGIATGCVIEIDKRIPSPAGLGGGSSNAASVLLALNELHNRPLKPDQLRALASRIGADCPFFLNGPAARATGIGTDLRSVPAPEGWIVLAVPETNEPAKTAKLYGALNQADYCSGESIDATQRTLESGSLTGAPLFNSFLKPAGRLFPELADLETTMRSVCNQAHLSGAGPALFAIASSQQEADAWAALLRTEVSPTVTVLTARFPGSRPHLEISQ